MAGTCHVTATELSRDCNASSREAEMGYDFARAGGRAKEEVPGAQQKTLLRMKGTAASPQRDRPAARA